MNYIHHAFIGAGTVGLGILAAEWMGMPQITASGLGMGVVLTAAGAIATDLDHPKSFISHSIPSRLLRIALAILTIPTLAFFATLLTTPGSQGVWGHFTDLLLGMAILRWSLIAVGGCIGLMGLAWLLYKSLHHRGALHSLAFTLAITLSLCAIFISLGQAWVWGLFFGWGWLWHILADGMTKDGVPFFWPVNDDRKHTLPEWACGLGRVMLSLSALLGIIALVYLFARTVLI